MSITPVITTYQTVNKNIETGQHYTTDTAAVLKLEQKTPETVQK